MGRERTRRHALVVSIAEAIHAQFERGDWTELGYRTGTREWLGEHPRLFRSLYFGDDDYKMCVYEAIEHVLEDDGNLQALLEMKKIRGVLEDEAPELLAEFSDDFNNEAVEDPELKLTSATVERILKDIEAKLGTGLAPDAVDRAHTALHGHLEFVCAEANLNVSEDASLTKLFKELRKKHPAFQAGEGVRKADIENILNSFANVVDKLNPIRNRASLAHPNEQILAEPEAKLVIHAARTILHYVDDKLKAYNSERKGLDDIPF
jgi:hypothetical protein